MLIHHDPDEYMATSEMTTCGYHQMYPGKPYAGCTCSAVYGSVRRPPEEVAAIKAKRRREEEDDILRRADAIRAARTR